MIAMAATANNIRVVIDTIIMSHGQSSGMEGRAHHALVWRTLSSK